MTSLPDIPVHLRQLMAEIGPKWASDTRGHIKLMIDRFSEILINAPKEADVTPSIVYGAHERQQFDLFKPRTDLRSRETGRPGLVFVHGGAFTEGSRHRSAEVYANVLYYFARHGIVGINSGYRLAPDAVYPEATRDIAKIVQWMRDNTDELGVDPKRIFLMGHSAGGAHVGSYAYNTSLQPAAGHGLAGLIVVSGRMRADNRSDNPNAKRVEAYYGADASRYDEVTPITHVNADSVPTFIAMAEFENPLIDVYCLELAYKLAAAKGFAPPTLWLKEHNHTSIIAHMNTSEEVLGQAILRFIDAH